MRARQFHTRTGVALLAAAGVLALTGCSGAGTSGGGSSASEGAASSSSATSTTTASPTATTSLAAGEDPYAVASLTADGEELGGFETGKAVDLSPEADAFWFAMFPVCSQLHVDVTEVADGAWQTAPSDMQPAVGCSGEEAITASEAVARLFDGEVAVETADDGTLTLTRDGVELVLTPEG